MSSLSSAALGPSPAMFGPDSFFHQPHRSQAMSGEAETSPQQQRRSDILDADKYTMVLDKSNLILLGPTGSGEQYIITVL